MNPLLQDDGNWIESQTVNFKLYDAGTDLSLNFGSMDTDLDQGVHFNSGQHVGTLVIKKH
jgi:hypothetical protein